ncbi:Gfo/Idh/MocA family protein [Lacinutrix jangbogonensis]|uniref:Gfo/Idh/MocA family protein n=1 Tax=Lacinutrix jangbogonensis TaxID=1469557 RepID=UPI00053E23C7|nr:Gfo/Idh/MocA family oxidoreductase [Lacinutrix jangbogonensis]
MQKIKWAVIGLGKIAEKFATDIKQVPNCELYAVASRTLTKANQFADKHNVANAYDSYEELLKNDDIDAVYIATPHSLHKENTIDALNSKKAVLCEKPLALNGKDVSKMIAAAKQNNTLFMEALWTSFLPHFKEAKAIVTNKKINSIPFGKLIKLEADFGFQAKIDPEGRIYNKNLGGGSLMDVGIYPVFCSLSILGKPNKIDAKAVLLKNGIDASCDITFTYNTFKAYLKSSIIENTRTEAIFTFENCKLIINSRFHAASTLSIVFNDVSIETIKLDFNYSTIGYSYEIDHFNNLIRANKTESDVMDFQSSIDLMEILDTIKTKINLDYKS